MQVISNNGLSLTPPFPIKSRDWDASIQDLDTLPPVKARQRETQATLAPAHWKSLLSTGLFYFF